MQHWNLPEKKRYKFVILVLKNIVLNKFNGILTIIFQ